jgi:hypothetical protein
MTIMRPATLDDVSFVATRMRVEDAAECHAGGMSPLDALTLSYETSLVVYALLEPVLQVPGAILGVCPGVYPKWGAIWLLGTDAIRKYRTTFLRNSKPALAHLYEETQKDVLYNYTFCENTVHHAWLRWLGFTFLRKINLPPHGQPFYEFVKIKG